MPCGHAACSERLMLHAQNGIANGRSENDALTPRLTCGNAALRAWPSPATALAPSTPLDAAHIRGDAPGTLRSTPCSERAGGGRYEASDSTRRHCLNGTKARLLAYFPTGGVRGRAPLANRGRVDLVRETLTSTPMPLATDDAKHARVRAPTRTFPAVAFSSSR